MIVVAAVIEREDRRILIGQRRRADTSPLKWEFPGGKVEVDEPPGGLVARSTPPGREAGAGGAAWAKPPSSCTGELR